jgi:hypothetical protein
MLSEVYRVKNSQTPDLKDLPKGKLLIYLVGGRNRTGTPLPHRIKEFSSLISPEHLILANSN